MLHTSPSSLHPSKNLGYWKTIDDDYHWHIEILPVLASKARSYTFKEVYYSPVSSETAVKQLREAKNRWLNPTAQAQGYRPHPDGARRERAALGRFLQTC